MMHDQTAGAYSLCAIVFCDVLPGAAFSERQMGRKETNQRGEKP